MPWLNMKNWRKCSGATVILPFKTNRIYKVLRWVANSKVPNETAEYEEVDSLDSADIVSSQWAHTALHTVVLDIDVPAMLVESSTPGHHHLYIDTMMTWERYKVLLVALSDAGVIEEGFMQASLARGFSAVRLPWVGKGYAIVDRSFGLEGKADEPS